MEGRGDAVLHRKDMAGGGERESTDLHASWTDCVTAMWFGGAKVSIVIASTKGAPKIS